MTTKEREQLKAEYEKIMDKLDNLNNRASEIEKRLMFEGVEE